MKRLSKKKFDAIVEAKDASGNSLGYIITTET